MHEKVFKLDFFVISMYGTGMPDIKYVPHRDAVQIRLEGTEMPYIFMARGCQGTEMPLYIYIRNQYGTGMPDFWPIQLVTGALPNVPFPPITLVFICLPTSRKLLKRRYICSKSEKIMFDLYTLY